MIGIMKHSENEALVKAKSVIDGLRRFLLIIIGVSSMKSLPDLSWHPKARYTEMNADERFEETLRDRNVYPSTLGLNIG
ncbi:hypothetical protein GGR95_003684 [Sulfitobacter undariae]|uniref:Uncharacterized protein n=1 Tax=Sulfitobacter undariae TaxID=1563671 RepID=A0A7W6H2P3_9RHOB|nr:hypothetical protein [Sulfitobacter undariae]